MTLRLLGGKWKGRILKSPQGLNTRPTTGILRGAVFNICQHQIMGARFLDLFAGSGAMGLEALSRGAESAVFVEQDSRAIRSIRENIKLLQAEDGSEVLPMDIFLAINKLAKSQRLFDIIYVDPPYAKAPVVAARVLSEIEKLSLLAPHGFLFIEGSTQGPKLVLESTTLSNPKTRRFGIAQLHQFELLPR